MNGAGVKDFVIINARRFSATPSKMNKFETNEKKNEGECWNWLAHGAIIPVLILFVPPQIYIPNLTFYWLRAKFV